MKRKNTLDLVLCALCAALTCALAPISLPVPFSPVPITLATLGVLISGGLLGAKYGALSQLVYLLLGAAGLPVFAGFTSGIGILAGYSGGYLIGYIFMSFLTGALYFTFGRKVKSRVKKTACMAAAGTVGTIALYLFGTIWFLFVMKTTLLAAMVSCVVPFLVGDIFKIAAASVLVPQVEAALRYLPQGKAAV